MRDADGWFMCRAAVRAVGLAAGEFAVRSVREEWPSIAVIEVDHRIADQAAELALSRDLRSLDVLHLAAARLLPADALVVATWDRRLHAAALAVGLSFLPERLYEPA